MHTSPLILAHEHGADALAEWASLWTGGYLPWYIVEIWTDSMVRPFYKKVDEGDKIRPILSSESLVKLAIGALISGLQSHIADACGARQYGAGRSGGATLEVAEVRAAARIRPTMALVSRDVKNASGSVEWPDALDACMRLVPAIAPALAAMWAPGKVQIHVEVTNNQW